MRSVASDELVERAKRLVDVYNRKKMSANVLISEIAGLATPETVDDIMHAVTPEVRQLFKQWIPSLPDDDDRRIILWPLPPGVTPAFKKWLQEYERNGQCGQQQL